MADYFPVLSRAVAGLENNTGEARRAVYERARAAIVRQLRAIEPPLAEEDISRERMQLEEAIRRIEANAAGARPAAPKAEPPKPEAQRPEPPKAAPSGSSEPPKTPEPPKPDPVRTEPAKRPPTHPEADGPAAPGRPADSRRGDPQANAAVGSGDRPAGPRAGEPSAGAASPRPATRPDGRPIIRAAGEQDGREKRSRSGLGIALATLAVILVGAGLFLARGQIAALFGGGAQPEIAQTTVPAPSAPPTPDTQAGKSDDRLQQDSTPAERPAEDRSTAPAETARTEPPAPPAEQEVARAPDVAPPVQTPPAADQRPSGPPVAQRAVLYEEGPNQQSGEALTGTILWRNESVSGGSNQPLETAIRGDVEIPGRNLRAAITIRRNADATLPASHTIEVQFILPEKFPNAGVANVPGVLMKADESARGAAVAGLSVRVTNGFFLIGLSNLETERSMNEQLLRDRGWIDIPILYDNGRRAVLTLEKGTPGAQAFQDAFSAWRSASAAANPAAGQAR